MMSSFLLPAQVGPDAILAQTPKQDGRVGTLPMLYRYTPHALVLAIAGIMAGCSSTPPQNSAHKIPNKKITQHNHVAIHRIISISKVQTP